MALYEETKQLQEERNAKFPGAVVPQKSFAELFQENAHLFKNLNYETAPILETTPIEIDRPDSWERRLGRFYNPVLEQENLLAEQQSGLQRMAYMIPRIATKAVAEIAQMPGYLGGAVAWGTTGFRQEDIGMMVNNWWQKGVQGMEDSVKDRLPVYTSDVVKSGNIWDNIFSTAFWANEGADGVGFLLAYLVPGAALRFAGTGAKMAKLIKPGTAFLKGLKAGATAEETASALAGTRFAGSIDDITSTIVNTLFESSAEAGQSFQTVLDKTGDRQKAATAAVDVLTKNFGILGVSNYIDQKWLFGNSKLIKEYAEKGVASGLKKGSMFSRVLGPTGAPLDAMLGRTTWENIGQLSKTVTKGFAKEGFYEEGMQYVAQKRAEAGVPNDNNFLEEIIDVGKTYADSLGDVDFQKSVLLGGLMGSVMAGVKTVRDIKAEDQLLGNFHKLVKNNDINWTTGYSDLMVKNDDGSLATDENGKYIPDAGKGREFIANRIKSYIRNKQLVALAKDGDIEGFELLRNHKIFEQFLPFIQLEGGLEAAYHYINNLAETDVAHMKEEGIATKDVNVVKQELRDKVTAFQKIYDRVNDTHDINMNVKIAKGDEILFRDFSDKVKQNKIETELDLQYTGERISDLRNQLAAFKMSNSNIASITSPETKFTTKIVDDLNKSLDTYKSEMTPTDITNAENIIQNIGGHIQVSDIARNDLADLYNKKSLQKEFKSFKEYKVQSTADANKSAVDIETAKESTGLTPNLLDLYNKSVKFESVGNDVLRRSGEVSMSFTDETGKLVTLTTEVLGKNENNNLGIKVLNEEFVDNTGKLVSVVPADNIGSINADGTITYHGVSYAVKPEDIGVTKPPKITVYPTKDISSNEPIPEENFDKAFDTEQVHIQLNDPLAKHAFNIEKGLDNWLVSTGNQDQVVTNDDLGRWHLFVNKLADLRLQTGQHRFYVKTYTLNQVGLLAKDDFIRVNTLFYTGNTDKGNAILKTYDQLEDKTNKDAVEDIKIVVFDRTTNTPLRVSKNGELDTDDKTQIIFNSLPLPDISTSLMKERFATNKIQEDYLAKQLNVVGRKASTEELAKSKVWADEEVKKTLDLYKDFRSALKVGSTVLEINNINPGIKQYGGARPLDVLEGTHIPNIALLSSRIHMEAVKPGSEAFGWNSIRTISGTSHTIRNGFWYVEGIDNRLELIKPKTLGDTGSVDIITSLLQRYAKNPLGEVDLERYLKSVIYTGINNTTGQLSPFRLFFVSKKDTEGNAIKGSLDKLVFGDNEIPVEDLIASKDIDVLKTFLGTKFWNFNNKLKDVKTFTEFSINKKGETITNTWEPSDGGYLGFLFSPANDNTTKGSVFMRPQEKQGLAGITSQNTNYLNQSLNLIQQGTKVEQVVEKVVGVAKAVGKKTRTLAEALAQQTTEVKPPVKTTVNPLAEPIVNKQTFKFGEVAQGLDELAKPIITSPIITPTDIMSYERFLEEIWNNSPETQTLFNNDSKSAYAIYKNAQKKPDDLSSLDRLSTAYDNYELENLSAAKVWLKEKFPEIPVEIIDGLIDNKSWGRLTRHAKILLSSIAEVGTGYHEGFHAFSQLVLSEQVKGELYNEVRSRLKNKDLTDIQTEEILAEEFRNYMLSPNAYTFGKDELQKKNLFERILDIILKIFHINKTNAKDFQIEMTFDILKNNSFGVTPRELPMDFDKIANLSPKESLILLKDFNYTFLNDVLFNPEAPYTETSLFNMDNSMQVLYNAVKGHYMWSAKSDLRQKVLDNFDALIDEHLRYLRQYKIDIRGVSRNEEVDTPEDEVDDKSSNTFKDYLQVNMADLTPDPIRLLVASLPDTNDRSVESLSGYKARSTARFNKTMSFLFNSLTGLGNNFDNYAARLRELSQFRGELIPLLKVLGVDKDTLTRNEMLLQNQFVKTFSKNKGKPNLFRYGYDGTKYFFSPVEDSNDRVIRLAWLNSARRNLGNSYIMKSASRGKFIINTANVQADITAAQKLEAGTKARLDAYLGILDKLGIRISNNTKQIFNYKPVDEYIKYLSQEIKARKGKELSIQDLYNRDVIQNQSEVSGLVEYTKQFTTNDEDLSYYNQDGNREYSIGLNSHNSDVVNSMNRITINPITGKEFIPTEVENLMPWDGTKGNLFGMHSKWSSHRRSGGKLERILLKGVTTPNVKQGVEISKSFFGDYKALEFNAVLNGIFPDLRAADRKTEYSTFLGKPDYAISRGSYKNDMMNYLRDELVTSFALLIDPINWGGNLANYSINAKSLRVFNFLYDKEFNADEALLPISLEEFSKRIAPEDTRDTITKANELVEQYITEYETLIDRSFDKFITRDTDFMYQSLVESKMIEEDVSATSGKVLGIWTLGIDSRVIDDEDKFNIKRGFNGAISLADMNRIILFTSNAQFVSGNEQLKLFMGDIAFWDGPVDFHKRVTGSTSPKQALADGVTLRSNLEKNFKRVDGKNKRTSSATVVVVDDVITQNEDLITISPKYGEIKSTDAASASMLDEHRDMKIRDGDWPPHLERTYQYEMQKFVLRMIELKKTKPELPFMDKISTNMFVDPDGVFYEHTGGVLPKTPMFNGKELKVSKELGIITIEKPQGFGNIEDIKGLNAIQYFKTAIAPTFLSSIEDDSPILPVILSMMDNKQGFLAFRSSMKGTIVGKQSLFDENGNIPLDGYVSQELGYKDFGLQLDIAEKGKTEVTASTQQQRLLFSNIFDRGKIVKAAELGVLHNEDMNLINEIIEMKREYLINKFGLIKEAVSGKYGLPNTTEAKNKFLKELGEAFEHRLMPSNIIEGIELALESNERIFDLTPSKFKIEEVLMAEIRHHIISRKTAGDMLIQESPVMYNTKLKFYDGTNPMEVMVSLPLSLVDWCEELGGIDVLNKAITGHNTKLLGKDFFKILDVPMNRIPGQNLSSLDIARIVKFHPHYHGAKVTLPAEITVKANSDFDVDKMTSYLNNFEVDPKTNKIKFYTDLNTLEGKQNRLNEIIKEALLHSDRFAELVEPLTADHILALANEARKRTFDRKTPIEKEVVNTIDEAKKGNFKWSNALAWWYNMEIGRNAFKGKLSMATANIHNVANARAQATPVRMRAYVPLFFKGQRYTKEDGSLDQDQYYNTGFVKDSDGQLISKNFASFVSAFVDAVKNPGVFELTDEKSYNSIALLNRHGIDEGVGLESIAPFLTQDIILDYQRLVRSNQPRYLSFNEWNRGGKYQYQNFKLNYNQQYATAITDLKTRLGGTETNIPRKYTETVTASLDKLLKIDKRLPAEDSLRYETEKAVLDRQIGMVLKEIRDKIDKYGYKDFTKTELKSKEIRTSFKDQVQILDNFLMYQLLGNKLTGLNMFLRPDARSSMYRHIAAVQGSVGILYQTLDKEGLFHSNDIAEAVFGQPEGNASLITEYYKTKEMTGDLFGWTSMVHKDPVIQGFFDDNVYSVLGNPARWAKKTDLDKAYTDIESDFLTFILADSYNLKDPIQLQEMYKSLVASDNDIPHQLLKLQEEIKDNLALKELQPNIAQRINRTRALSETNTITTSNRSLEPYTVDAIEGDLKDLAKTHPEFVTNLVRHSIFQSGFHNAINSYMQVVPPKFFIELAQDAITRFSTLPDDLKREKLQAFLEQMYRNNAYNTLIVPRANYHKNNLSNYRDKNNFYSEYDYISFNYYTANPKSYRKIKTNPPQDILLYKRIPGTLDFKLITKLGNGLNFKEFYPMLSSEELDKRSIVESNQYKKQPLDVTFEEAPLRQGDATDENSSVSNSLVDEVGYESPEDESGEELPPPETTEESLEKTFDATMFEKGYVNYIGEGQENSYVKTLGSKSTIQQALRVIEGRTPDQSLRELARVLRPALSRRVIPLTIDRLQENVSTEAKKYYEENGEPMFNGIYYYHEDLSELGNYVNRINVYERLNDKGFEVTTLHEAIHALAQYEYEHRREFSDKLDRLVEYTKNYLLQSKNSEVRTYAERHAKVFADPTEFLAYGMTESAFQNTLAKIPAENPELVEGKLIQHSVLYEFINSLVALVREHFNKVFGTSDPTYNERVQKLTSVLHELTLLTQEDLLTPEVIPTEEETVDLERTVTTEDIKSNNVTELDKEGSKNFDDLYKEYDYLNNIEQEAFQDAVNKGIIEIACGI